MRPEDIVYPFTDEYGYSWYTPSSFIGPQKDLAFRFKAPCFICGRLVPFIDIDYHGYFCDSYACNLAIELDLKGVIKLEPASGKF